MKNALKFFFKNHYKYLFFCFFLLGLNAVLIFSMRHQIGGQNVLIISTLLLVLLILMVIIFWLKEKKHFELHKIFLIVAPILGLFYLFIMPPAVPPDETTHFRRAYEISEGFIVSDRNEDQAGGHILPDSISIIGTPVSSYSELPEAIQSSIDTTTESFQIFSSASLYSPVSYLPEIVGIWLGRLLHLPMFIIFYLARFFNLITYIILIYFALKFIPSAKSAIFLLALSPIALQAAASCQADALVNGSIFTLAALVLHKVKYPTTLTKQQKFSLSFLTFLIAMCKIVYFPFCFLVCLIPRQCFRSKKDKTIKLTILLVTVIALNLLWLLISSGYLMEFHAGVNSGEQVKYILTHPIHYIITIVSSFTDQGLWYFTSAFSGYLGYFNISLSFIYLLIFCLILFYSYLGEDASRLTLKVSQKFFLSALLIICFLLICTSLYVQWTPVASPLIDGIQGRYFLPLIPLTLLLLTPFANRRTSANQLYPIIFIVAFNIYALASYLAYYIV